MFNRKSLTAALIAGAFSLGASADILTTDAGLTLIEDFESFGGIITTGPTALGGGASVSSTIVSTIGGYAVDLVDNGTWGVGNDFAAIGNLNTSAGSFVGSMTFSFASAVSRVGALFSTYNDGTFPAEITIEALGLGGSALEMYTFIVDLDDPDATNAGVFRGFQFSGPDILGLRVSGDGFVVDNLSTTPVPVPAALPLLLSGIAGLTAMARRRRSRVTA